MSDKLMQLQQELIHARMERARLYTLITKIEARIPVIEVELEKAENATAILENSSAVAVETGLSAVEQALRNIPDRDPKFRHRIDSMT